MTLGKWARFRDMKPAGVDSNLYSYHLKRLMKDGYVERHEAKGYRLTPTALCYVDHVSLETFEPRWQPKILTKVHVTNEHGGVLMWPKYKQPFKGTWSLPSGKMHYDDVSAEAAMRREISYFTNSQSYIPQARGIVEIVTAIEGEMVAHAIEYLFSMQLSSGDLVHQKAQWIAPHDIGSLKCSPGTSEVLALLQGSQGFFSETLQIDW